MTTLPDKLAATRANRVWVMDRGMVSQENLKFLRARDGQYIVGTPQAKLRQFEEYLTEKEKAMHERFVGRLEDALGKMQVSVAGLAGTRKDLSQHRKLCNRRFHYPP